MFSRSEEPRDSVPITTQPMSLAVVSSSFAMEGSEKVGGGGTVKSDRHTFRITQVNWSLQKYSALPCTLLLLLSNLRNKQKVKGSKEKGLGIRRTVMGHPNTQGCPHCSSRGKRPWTGASSVLSFAALEPERPLIGLRFHICPALTSTFLCIPHPHPSSSR